MDRRRVDARAGMSIAAPVVRRWKTMILNVRVGLSVALALGAVAAAHAQHAPEPLVVNEGKFAAQSVDMRVERWRDAARTHASGQFDAAAVSIAEWPADLTHVVVARAIRQQRKPGEPGAAEDRTTLAKGLVLHTDIAIAERTRVAGTANGMRAQTVLDGKPFAPTRISTHWLVARRLADALAKDPAGAPSARGWYRAVAALYQQWADLGQLHAHLDAARSLFGDDPVLLLFAGTLHQTFGDPRLEEYVRGRLADRRNRQAQPEVETPSRDEATGGEFRNLAGRLPSTAPAALPVQHRASKAELDAAERHFRRALSLDPALHEARIRLAHVLSDRGDDAQAADVVRPALAAPLPPFFEFYAALVLGRCEERLGRHAAADEAYARAAARFPGAQSAEIGRSRVALAQGRSADALAIVVAVAGPGTTVRPDPWPSYFRLHDPDADTLLAAWRAGLR